jgi:hypothetical protein
MASNKRRKVTADEGEEKANRLRQRQEEQRVRQGYQSLAATLKGGMREVQSTSCRLLTQTLKPDLQPDGASLSSPSKDVFVPAT